MKEKGDTMDHEDLYAMEELLEAQHMLQVNRDVSMSLRKKGIKLREFKWHECQAS